MRICSLIAFVCIGISSSQGKQDLTNSKIHYLSLHPGADLNDQHYKSRSNLLQNLKRNKNIKESKKINIDIDFINNGRPYRVNSKKSKMLSKKLRQPFTNKFHVKSKSNNSSSSSNHVGIIKLMKNINSDRENNKKSSHHHKKGLNVTENNKLHKSGKQKTDNLKSSSFDIKGISKVSVKQVEAECVTNKNHEIVATNKTIMINLPNESANDSKNLTKEVENLVKQSNQQVSSSLSFDTERSHHHHQIVPASTIKITNRNVPSINRHNHRNFMNFMNTHSSSPPWNKNKQNVEKTHLNKINHKLTEIDQNSNLIPFSNNKHKIATVAAPLDPFHHQSFNPGFRIRPITTYPSFFYNIISPTSGHGHLLSIPAAPKYGPILSNPYLSFFNHVPRVGNGFFRIISEPKFLGSIADS